MAGEETPETGAAWVLKFHRDVIAVDVPKLARISKDPVAYGLVRRRTDKALREIMEDPLHRGSALRKPPLSGWRKYKFFSSPRPESHARPDMRIIYRLVGSEIRVLALGQRRPGDPLDVYAVAEGRSEPTPPSRR